MLIFTCIHETAFLMITIEPSCIICSDDRPQYAVISLEISLSIETPKTINFPFVPNGKINVFRCSDIFSTFKYCSIEHV